MGERMVDDFTLMSYILLIFLAIGFGGILYTFYIWFHNAFISPQIYAPGGAVIDEHGNLRIAVHNTGLVSVRVQSIRVDDVDCEIIHNPGEIKPWSTRLIIASCPSITPGRGIVEVTLVTDRGTHSFTTTITHISPS
ncbi:MAG: hypothetical protein QXM08_01195 [Thermofilaceae archaeon]